VGKCGSGSWKSFWSWQAIIKNFCLYAALLRVTMTDPGGSMKTLRKSGKLFSFALVLVLSLGMLACTSAPAEVVDPFVPGSGTFVLLHTNDMHGRLVAGSSDGMGLDRISTLVKTRRNAGEAVLLLDAGDALHGQPAVTLSRGKAMVDVMNAIGYEAFVPGNHDFNYGQARLLELAAMADFPMLAANITVDATGKSFLQPYMIKDVGGVTVAIFGLATPETLTMSHPDNSKGITYGDPTAVAQAMVQELRGKADVLVALAHLGFVGPYDSRELAKKVSGIDIIVDGHSHTLLPQGEVVGSTLIVSAHEYNKNLGQVQVVVENGTIVSMTASYVTKETAMTLPADQAIIDLIAKINDEQKLILAEKVGVAAVDLNGERGIVRTQESAFGNMIGDAYIAVTGADMSFQNGGGIRSSVKAGDVTMGQILSVFPFSNRLITISLSGAKVLAALEHSVRLFPAENGGFMHVGGIRFSFDPSRPAGSRVNPAKVSVKGQPLDLNRNYKVATIDFLASGGDGYVMFKDAANYVDLGDLTEVLANHFRTKSPVSPVIDNRIVTGTW